MSRFIVKGLSGRKKLSGEIPVRGAKNAVLKAFAASLLFKKGMEISNAPVIEDVLKMTDILRSSGANVTRSGERSYFVSVSGSLNTVIEPKIAKLLRSSIVLTGPMLAREGRVSFPHPGGCVIGARPIDVFFDSYRRMGAKISEKDGMYVIECDRLKGADIFFRVPSVTGTETVMMAAVLAKGVTRIFNAACEPEVQSLADFLKKSGADIKGEGTHEITVKGGKLLNTGKFVTPPDRIEAGSLAVLGAVLGKKIRVTDCDPSHMRAVLHAFESAGIPFLAGKSFVEVKSPKVIRNFDIKTGEYPGFPTDLQAPFAVLLTQAVGQSKIFETIFEGRLGYLNDLSRMGAGVVICDQHRAIIDGPSSLRGRDVESPDLRAGLAFLAAAMVAEGDSVIRNAGFIDRGYEKIEDRLNKVGAEIKRADD